MIFKLVSGLIAKIMGFFGLGAPAQEAAPAPEQEQVAVAWQGNNDEVQALIDAAQAEAGYDFISVRYEGDTAHIALNPETYNPDKDEAAVQRVMDALKINGYDNITAAY